MISFSVVTCVKNGARYLERSLQSTLKQAYPHKELIVVYGESTDNSLDIAQSFGKRLTLIRDPGLGISHAMNVGIAHAHGDVIAFLHSDDMFFPDTLAQVARAFEAHPEALWLYGRAAFMDAYDNVMDIHPALPFSFKKMLRYNYIYHQATFMKRTLFEQGFIFDETLKVRMDQDLWLRLGPTHAPLVVQETYCYHRIHGQSASFSQISKSNQEGWYLRAKYGNPQFKDRLDHHAWIVPKVICTTWAARLKSKIWHRLPPQLRWKALRTQES